MYCCILCKHRLVSLFDPLMEETHANEESFIFKMHCACLDFSLFTIYINSSMCTAFKNVTHRSYHSTKGYFHGSVRLAFIACSIYSNSEVFPHSIV